MKKPETVTFLIKKTNYYLLKLLIIAETNKISHGFAYVLWRFYLGFAYALGMFYPYFAYALGKYSYLCSKNQ